MFATSQIAARCPLPAAPSRNAIEWRAIADYLQPAHPSALLVPAIFFLLESTLREGWGRESQSCTRITSPPAPSKARANACPLVNRCRCYPEGASSLHNSTLPLPYRSPTTTPVRTREGRPPSYARAQHRLRPFPLTRRRLTAWKASEQQLRRSLRNYR